MRQKSIVDIKEMVKTVAEVHSIEIHFIFALIEAESNWDQWAVKYEPGYRWAVKNPDLNGFKCSKDTIDGMQSFSYGLCQIMGSHFYEFGYKGFCTQLLEPNLNIEIACKLLKWLKEKWGDNPASLYAAYNAGSVIMVDGQYQNQENVDRFMDIYNDNSFCSNLQNSVRFFNQGVEDGSYIDSNQ